jgi:hypothetical protein
VDIRYLLFKSLVVAIIKGKRQQQSLNQNDKRTALSILGHGYHIAAYYSFFVGVI